MVVHFLLHSVSSCTLNKNILWFSKQNGPYWKWVGWIGWLAYHSKTCWHVARKSWSQPRVTDDRWPASVSFTVCLFALLGSFLVSFAWFSWTHESPPSPSPLFFISLPLTQSTYVWINPYFIQPPCLVFLHPLPSLFSIELLILFSSLCSALCYSLLILLLSNLRMLLISEDDVHEHELEVHGNFSFHIPHSSLEVCSKTKISLAPYEPIGFFSFCSFIISVQGGQ